MDNRKLTGETIRINENSQTSISSAIKSLQQAIKTKADKLDSYTQSEIENLLEEIKKVGANRTEQVEQSLKEITESIRKDLNQSLQTKVDKQEGKGLSTNDFTDELKLKLLTLKQGLNGKDGQKGDTGLSAYEIAKQEGFIGTQSQWLKSLKGDKGDRGEKGEKGTQGEQGVSGKNGLSAYEIARKNGFIGTEAKWLESLKGKDGKSVQYSSGAGPAGASAYQIAVRHGFKGSEQDWLKSLKGTGSGGSADYNDLYNKPDLSIYAEKDDVFDKEEIHELLKPLKNGTDAHYIHIQTVAASTWLIDHTLNKYPSVSIIDSAGSQVEGSVTYISINRIKVEFSAPFSGRAILN